MNKIETGNSNLDLYTGGELNSDEIVGFVAPQILKGVQGYLDKPTVFETMYSKYDEKSHIKHLGMLNLMGEANKVHLPMMHDLLKGNAVLEVAEGTRVQYDLPIPREPSDTAIVMVDTSTEEENGTLYAGVPFKVILDRPFTAGDILKPNPTGGFQVRVSNDEDVEPYGGGAWLHYVIYDGNGKSKNVFPKQFLKEGMPFFKIGHKNGEYGTQFSTISSSASMPSHMTLEWTPSSVTTVETAITRKAALMSTNGATQISNSMSERLNDMLNDFGGFDKRGAFITTDLVKGADGKQNLDGRKMKVSTTLEYLAMVELHKMEAWTNMFAEAQVVHGDEGVIKINDGLWRQLRNGTIIEYTRPGGITLSDLAEASAKVYGNLSVPINQRHLVFKGGEQAVLNGIQINQKHADNFLSNRVIQLKGADSLLDKNKEIITGDNLNDLTLHSDIKFSEVFLPGVGYCRFDHDPSFDWNTGTTNYKASGFAGKAKNKNTYTLILDSATTKSGDVSKKIRGAGLIEGGDNNSTVYMVQPEGTPYVTWGKEQGRMNDGAKFRDVRSSSKYMAQNFWAIIDTDVLLLDTTKAVIIELKDTYLYE